MPLYEYKCLGCGNEFEQLVLPGGVPAACPGCGSKALERLLSTFAVSSDDLSRRNLRRARKAAVAAPDRTEQRVAEHEYVREHLAEEGITIPRSEPKPKN